MRQLWMGLVAGSFLILFGHFAYGQNTPIDSLDQDLKDIKKQREDATSQAFADFQTQTATAMADPGAAVNLYQTAGGAMPDATQIQTHYEHETPSEKAARDQADAEKAGNLGFVLQLHSGLLHYGALLVSTPDQKGLQADWINWLKSVPSVYVQLKEESDGGKKKGTVKDIKTTALRDSIIGGYLNYHGWADKEQGGWTVKELPRIYRSQVLEPLRATPTADTLAAWDLYISMKNVDQPDTDKWTNVEYPSLAFERACDDYKNTPTMDKLQVLVQVIKDHPSHPKVDEMISRTHDFVEEYKTRHPGSSAQTPTGTTTPTTPAANPNTSVTTTVQGDTTVITTHTNAAPENPAPPTPRQ